MNVRSVIPNHLSLQPAAKLATKVKTLSSPPVASKPQKTFAALLNHTVSAARVSKPNVSPISVQFHSAGQNSVIPSLPSITPIAPPITPKLPSNVGFNALVQTTPSPVQVATSAPTTHWYAANATDDAYWSQQPPAVQQLREIDNPAQRQALATQLAGQGYQIDVPIMVWGWDAGITNSLRASAGYTWVPSALQNPVSAAPGLTGPGITPYDPNNPPAGSISVSA